MDTREAVQSRIMLARADERTHGQFFVDTLAGFAELFGPEVAEEARAASPGLLETGVFSCPMADLLRITDAGASAAERRGFCTYPEVLERLGDYMGNSYFRSPVGQAFRRITGRNLLKSMELSVASTRAVTSYGERRYEPLGPTCARIVYRRELMGPLWIRAINTKVFRASSGLASVSATVEYCRESCMDFSLLYTWKLL